MEQNLKIQREVSASGQCQPLPVPVGEVKGKPMEMGKEGLWSSEKDFEPLTQCPAKEEEIVSALHSALSPSWFSFLFHLF